MTTTAGRALTLHAARQLRLGVLLVACAVGGMTVLVAGQYRATFAGSLDGTAMAALAANPAIRVLFGEPLALDDPGGFTVWRTGTAVQVVVAVWALLAATRVTRGEEDAGRAELLLAGRVTSSDLLVRYLATLAAGSVVVGVAVAAALLATGTRPAGALIHGAGVLGVALTFAAAGVLAAQVLPTRGAATGAAVALLGAVLALRMLADGVDRLAWLAWLTPFGLTARTAPYAGDNVGPLLVLAVFPVLLTWAAAAAARRRDVGGGLVAVSTVRRPRIRLLGSLTGFAVRRALGPTAGWAVGTGGYLLLVGGLTPTILDFLRENPRFADLAASVGFTELDTAARFAASMFMLLAIPAGLYAAGRVAAFAADEAARHWTGVLALPVTRTRLAAVEIVTAAAGTVVVLVVAGLAFQTGSPLGAGAALAGALNVAPVAALSLGAAVAALGWSPRLVAAIGALPVAGGFLLQVVAESIRAPAWVADLSPFAHLAAVPSQPVDRAGAAGLLLVSALLTALGLVGYTRRDLTT